MSGTIDEGGRAGPAGESINKDFLVVGLGGSAGSIPSFREFFRNVQRDSGMAYVVVIHLSPEHESHLAEVLQSMSAIPVSQVSKSVRVEPDHVYVIPPNKSLAMTDGMLQVSDISTFEQRRAPIDMFFRTLADSHESRAACVIVSGSGSDGSMGLRRIKENNGLVLVQDPAEAAFGEMPRNSIATGLVDFVITVSDMPKRIATYRDQLRAIRLPESREQSTENEERALMEIFTLLRLRTGHDFTNYKRATVLRRIQRRLAVRDMMTMSDYAIYLRDHQDETLAFLRELLISVTNFFRDREVWEKLEREVIPRIVESKRQHEHVRVWIAGCATGEEAYSMAMLLAERSVPNVQIFATDLDAPAIDRARNGCYNEAEVADVSPERLRRFFQLEKDGYRVRRELREMVLFAHHNLIKDPPFSHLDLASCRNLLIYLNRTAQQRAMEVLHFALEPGGYLLLGTAESADASARLFSVVDKESHIFQSRPVDRVISVAAPPLPLTSTIDVRSAPTVADLHPGDPRRPERFAPIDLHQRLLEEYAPPSLIVDDQYNIVHLTERAGRFLSFPAGEASVNLLHVVSQELRMAVRSALFQAAQKRSGIATGALTFHGEDFDEKINVIVRPSFREKDATHGLFLVLFDEVRDEVGVPAKDETTAEPASRQLEDELLRVKMQMRATIEQYEIQAEESKASNEELQAMNEELRSTAEELETSQEELQSVNEELRTVNQELKVKIDETTHANDDMRNLMSSTDIGTIFIDRALRVKLFTPKITDIFNLIPADIGRPLLDITSRLTTDGLSDDIARVLQRLQTIEREVETREGGYYLMRLLTYRTSEDRIDGVVVTFIDITQRRRAEAHLEAVANVVPDLLWSNEPDGMVDWINDRWTESTGQTLEEARIRGVASIVHPDDRDHAVSTFGAALASGQHLRLELRLRGTSDEFRWYLLKAEPLRDLQGRIVRWFGAATDINEERAARDLLEQRVRERTRELEALSASRQHLLDRLVSAEEEERRRVARELHDEMGQHITALKVGLASMQPTETAERLNEIATRLDQSIDRLTLELRTPALDALGLDGAIRSLGEQFTKSSGVRVDIHFGGTDTTRLPEAIETMLYRVVQEALTNVWKHSSARNVSVIVERQPEQIRLIVEDDGVGFEPTEDISGAASDRFGLLGMRERVSLIGGTLNIESAPAKGTTLYVRVPRGGGISARHD